MSEWIEWNGGECPVPEGMRAMVTLRDHRALFAGEPVLWRWSHRGRHDDIVSYLVVDPNCLHPDTVNHPSHYTQGNIECIDAIKSALTPDEFRGYCKGNAMKYIWRERHKGNDESIAKAKWYMDKITERSE